MNNLIRKSNLLLSLTLSFTKTMRITEQTVLSKDFMREILGLAPSELVAQPSEQTLHGISIENKIFPPLPPTAPPVVTPMTRLYDKLSLSPQSSFQEYSSLVRTSALDLYGEPEQVPTVPPGYSAVQGHVNPPVPSQQQRRYLQSLYSYYSLNINIPGCVQIEDPKAFMDLRPIEDFKHTPLIPISDSAMRRHEEMVQRYHRKAYFFEVSSQSVLNGLLVAAAMLVFFYLIRQITRRQAEQVLAAQRRKQRRSKEMILEDTVNRKRSREQEQRKRQMQERMQKAEK